MEPANTSRQFTPADYMMARDYQEKMEKLYYQRLDNPEAAPSIQCTNELIHDFNMLRDLIEPEWQVKIRILLNLFVSNVGRAYDWLDLSFMIPNADPANYQQLIKIIREAATLNRYDPRTEIVGRVFNLEEMLKLHTLFHANSVPNDATYKKHLKKLNKNPEAGNRVTGAQIREFFRSVREQQNEIAAEMGLPPIHIEPAADDKHMKPQPIAHKNDQCLTINEQPTEQCAPMVQPKLTGEGQHQFYPPAQDMYHGKPQPLNKPTLLQYQMYQMASVKQYKSNSLSLKIMEIFASRNPTYHQCVLGQPLLDPYPAEYKKALEKQQSGGLSEQEPNWEKEKDFFVKLMDWGRRN